MAKTVNMGDKYEHRLTLRLTDEQFQFIVMCAELLGVSPSEYMRMSVNAYMVAYKKGMVGTNENVKTDIND